MKKVLTILLPILAIVAVVFIVTKFVMPQPVDLVVKCTECNEGFENAKGFAEGPWPMACPKCKQKTAYSAEIYHEAKTKKLHYLTPEEYEKAIKTKELIVGKP